MVKFQTVIQQFEKKGEKTRWTFITFSPAIAQKLNPGSKVSFRIKGKLDGHAIAGKALLPMGNGNFILPLKADLRKIIGKDKGDKIKVEAELDSKQIELSTDLIKCLKGEPRALSHFKSLPPSHQRYYSNWIEEAKTIDTKTRRITMTLLAMVNKQSFGEMLRAYRDGNLI